MGFIRLVYRLRMVGVCLALLGGQVVSMAGAEDFNLYMEGRFIFERNCVVCHGARGDGKGELSETLQPKPRSFREGTFKFRSTPMGKLPTDEDLKRTISGGLTGTAMGMFSQFSPRELDAVIAYVKSFSRLWRKEANFGEPVVIPTVPDWLRETKASATNITKGRELFLTNCAICHGVEGDGKGEAAAGLVDMWGGPSFPSDLRQPHLRCGDSAADIYRVLVTGLNGTPMVSFDAVLNEEQRWQVSAYVLSQRRSP